MMWTKWPCRETWAVGEINENVATSPATADILGVAQTKILSLNADRSSQKREHGKGFNVLAKKSKGWPMKPKIWRKKPWERRGHSNFGYHVFEISTPLTKRWSPNTRSKISPTSFKNSLPRGRNGRRHHQYRP